ncbi:MAG: restriction endonuclease subunit S [Bacteroidales bacterium]|nr:restriction endonuclease subunit S [Bacteroidales bacterium]
MNKIKKLIKELCPNGVEWKKLGEIGSFYGGLSGKTKEDFVNGNAIFITYKNIYSNPKLYMNPIDKVHISKNEKQNIIEYGDVLFTGSSETPDECGISSVVSEKPKENMYLNSFCFGFRLNDKSVYNIGFLSHLFRSNEIRAQIAKTASGVTRFNISKKLFANLLIPLPPLPIQTEIVRILDKFVEQQEQLERLIELKKKQYEYYREEMLTPKEGEVWEKVIMSDVCDLKAGKAISASELNDSNAYPCYGGNGIRGYISKYSHEGNFAIIGRQGALCGCVNWATKKFYATEHAVVVTPKNGNDSRFLYLLFTRANLNQYKSSGAQPGLAVNKLNELYFTIPSSKKQKQIVKILDFFETSIATLTSALELSKKRYEYYRDKMMRF